ncbi:MAG: hypothetical protein HKN94_12970 [Acidimicrobiales bacterium]|nr:hypothetical protein [Acidimicrobiales bacterium]RZV44708.1 MAG: hypothetical protein EX269_11305 [Acidimicrobiales bacterium]
MGESGPTDLRTIALRAFLASIAINAALGIWALLVDDFGDTQQKVLISSFLVSGSMLAILINGTPLSRRVLWPVPAVAVGGLVLGFALLLGGLWAEADSSTWGKILLTAFTIGGAATFSGLLALLPLRPAHQRLRLLTHLLIALLAASLIGVLWAEGGGAGIARVIGVQSILVAALTLALPALSRYRPVEESEEVSGSGHFCPACGAELADYALSGDPVACGSCKQVFSVTEEHRV